MSLFVMLQRIRNNKTNSNIDYSVNNMNMMDIPSQNYAQFSYPQGQGTYSDNFNMLNSENNELKDKDEALKMLYDMMMNRVNKKRKTN